MGVIQSGINRVVGMMAGLNLLNKMRAANKQVEEIKQAKTQQQKSFDQLKVSIGGQDIDISKLGKGVQEQIKENINGK